jgi:hypothetical protein
VVSGGGEESPPLYIYSLPPIAVKVKWASAAMFFVIEVFGFIFYFYSRSEFFIFRKRQTLHLAV